jgi:hypothetical protein
MHIFIFILELNSNRINKKTYLLIFLINIKAEKRKTSKSNIFFWKTLRKKWFYHVQFLSQNRSKLGFKIIKGSINDRSAQFQILWKSEKCTKTKNLDFSSFWLPNHRFFQKKMSKSEHRGGAEFGTHVWRHF